MKDERIMYEEKWTSLRGPVLILSTNFLPVNFHKR
jgi:hypothetical protein